LMFNRKKKIYIFETVKKGYLDISKKKGVKTIQKVSWSSKELLNHKYLKKKIKKSLFIKEKNFIKKNLMN